MEEVEKVYYKGCQFRVQSSGRYFQSVDRYAKHRLLHRRVWADHYGEIPDGHHIHHKDGNWRNNNIENLECVDGIEHRREHMKKNMQNPEYKANALKALNKAQEKAKEWHRSPEGRQWHREHAAKTLWINKEKKILKCENCKNDFEAYRDNVARFCSKNCRQKGCYAKQKTLEKICLFCNEKFLANKYRNINCCSRLCSNRLKAQKKI